MNAEIAPAQSQAPLVVFDFDHTLYAGDSGSHLFAWLIRRNRWRTLLACVAAPLFAPLIAFLPTRRHGISVFVWIGTVGFSVDAFEAMIDRYVASHESAIRRRLLPHAIATLQRHRDAGDRVLIATGAPPRLARAILAFVAHADVPVIGTMVGARLCGIGPQQHCHAGTKMRMLRAAGYGDIAVAYSDSSADLPLLLAARHPVVVNPKASRIALFRRVLPPGTPILNWGCVDRAGAAASGDAAGVSRPAA
jgi:phosphatidylglycerophosphatase C